MGNQKLSWFGQAISDYKKFDSDVSVMREFNNAIRDGMSSQKAFQTALSNTGKSIGDISKSAVDLMKNSDNSAVSIDHYTKSANSLSISSMAASVGVKLLSMALQSLVVGAFTWGIGKLIDVIDKSVHDIDNIRNTISDMESEYDSTASELKSVNSELEKTQQLISELENKDALTFVDQEKLDNLRRTNVELERQQRLLERQAALQASQLAEEKKNLFNKRFGDQTGYVTSANEYLADIESGNKKLYGDIYGQLGTENDQLDLASALASYQYLSQLLSDSFVQTDISDFDYEQYSDQFNQVEEILIGALDDLEGVRSNLLAMKIGGKTLTQDQEDILRWSEDYIASIWQTVDPEYWFTSNFNNIISDAAHKDAVAKLKDLSEQGKLTAEALSSSMTDTGIKAFVDELYAAGITDTAQIVAEINKLYGDINETVAKEQGDGYDAITSSLYSTKSAYEALSAAMEEQASAGKISAATYASLINQSSDFAIFLEKTADGYALNTDALNDYLETQNNFSKGKAINRIMELQDALANPNLTDDSINAYKAEISQLEVLISELDSATDAYARLTNARDTANQDAGYQNVKSGYEQFAKDRKRGKTNTDDFQTQVDYLLGEDWRSRIGSEDGYKNEAAAYKAAEEIFNRYYNYKEENELDGALKFVEDLAKADLYDKENDQIVASTIEEIAQVMQTSTANVRNLLGLLDTYGMAPELSFEIDESDKALAEKTAEIEKAQQKIVEIESEIKALEQQLSNAKESGASGEEYQQQLDTLKAEAESYRAIVEAGINGTGADTPLKNALAELNEVNNVLKTFEESGINIDVILGGDWADLKNYLEIDSTWKGLWGEEKSSKTVATYIPEEPISLPSVVDEQILKESVEEVAGSINKDPIILNATVETSGGENIAFNIDQSFVDEMSKLSQFALDFAKFEGFDDTFNATQLQSATTELNDAWNNLQSIEDTSSIEFQTASDRLGTAVINFVNAKASLESVIDMKQNVNIDADISAAERAINSLKGKTIYVTVKTIGDANAKGTKKAKGGSSIVDEEGAELILHKSQGTYELGTNQGARMTQLNPGDEVIPASETKKILRRSGMTGGAFATGTSAWKNISQLLSQSSNKSSSSSSSSKTKKVSSSSYKKYVEKLFDWIEVRLEALQRVTEGWIQSASEAVGYIAKNASLDKALANISKQMNDAAKAYGKYMTQADTIAKKAGLSADIVKKIQEGSIEIASYDDKTQEKIKNYKEWYDKALDVKDAIVDLREQEKELAAERLDNVMNHYQQRIDQIDAKLDYNSALVDLKGTTGVQIAEQDYFDSIDQTKQKLAELRAEHATLKAELDSMVQVGYIVEGSEQWYEYQGELNDLDVTILETSGNLQELIDLANNVALTNLQYAMSALERSASEVSHLMDLHEAQGQDHSASDYESLIKNGMLQIDNLHAQNAELRKQQEGLDVLSEKWQELQEKIDSNNDAINDMMVSQEQWNDAILDLKITEIEKYQQELAKVNDQYERQKALQQAIEDLERAKSQRKAKVYREGVGFVFEADQQAVQDAQEALDQLIHEETMNKLDDLIEAVENQKLDSNVYSANGTLLGQEYKLPSFVGYAELMNSIGSTNIVSSAMEHARKAAYDQTMGSVINTAPTTSLTIGDINVHGVDSPDALAEALLAEFPNAILQAMYGKL